MSKEKTMQLAVHQAVVRAAAVLKENDRDDTFSIDLGIDGILLRNDIHPRQLSFEGELFPTFTVDGMVI